MFDNEDSNQLWFKLAMNVLFASKSKSVVRRFVKHVQDAKLRSSSQMSNQESSQRVTSSINLSQIAMNKKKSSKSVSKRHSEAGTPKSKMDNESKDESRDDPEH